MNQKLHHSNYVLDLEVLCDLFVFFQLLFPWSRMNLKSQVPDPSRYGSPDAVKKVGSAHRKRKKRGGSHTEECKLQINVMRQHQFLPDENLDCQDVCELATLSLLLFDSFHVCFEYSCQIWWHFTYRKQIMQMIPHRIYSKMVAAIH